MNKREAARFVTELTVKSLRNMAKRITSGDIGAKASQKDVTKVKKELEYLASKLEKRLGHTIEGEVSHDS